MITKENHTVSFELVDGIILIPGRVGSAEGHFAFDTGATKTVLNSAYCKQSSDADDKSAVTFDAGTQSSRIGTADETVVSFGGLEATLQSQPVMDMAYVEQPLRASMPELCFLGSIGAELIGKGRLIVDYPSRKIVFNALEIPAGAIETALSVELLPLVELEIGGEAFRFILDTGANHYVFDQTRAPMQLLSAPDENGLRSIPSLVFAGEEYRDISGLVTDLSSVREAVPADGIIGYQVLNGHICCFDFENGRLYLARRQTD